MPISPMVLRNDVLLTTAPLHQLLSFASNPLTMRAYPNDEFASGCRYATNALLFRLHLNMEVIDKLHNTNIYGKG